MRKIYVVASREYLAAVRTKSFIVTVFFMPVLMIGTAGIQFLIDEMIVQEEKHFVVVDRSPEQRFQEALIAAGRLRNENRANQESPSRKERAIFSIEAVPPSPNSKTEIENQRFELSERVREGRLTGFLEIGESLWIENPSKDSASDDDETAPLRYQSNNLMYTAFRDWALRVIEDAILAERCAKAGVPREQLQALLRPVPMSVKGLSERDVGTGKVAETSMQSQLAAILVPAGLMILMFMIVMVGATPLMQGVVEEKSQKIAEVLLGSIRPFSLMLGKLLGMMGVSMTLASVYLCGAYWGISRLGFANQLPLGIIAWFLVFLTLTVLMYGSLFIAIGAACTDLKETQMLLLPVVLIMSLPLFTLRHVMQEPNGAFSTWVSFFPPVTPMLMITRLAIPPGVPWWQPTLGALGVLAATLGCVYLAGRVFRIGILMQGKAPRFTDLALWIFRG